MKLNVFVLPSWPYYISLSVPNVCVVFASRYLHICQLCSFCFCYIEICNRIDLIIINRERSALVCSCQAKDGRCQSSLNMMTLSAIFFLVSHIHIWEFFIIYLLVFFLSLTFCCPNEGIVFCFVFLFLFMINSKQMRLVVH
jgi:hypothetical protein